MSRRVTKLLFNVRRSYTAQDVKTKRLAIADSSRVSIPVTKKWVKGVGVADLLTTSSTTPLPTLCYRAKFGRSRSYITSVRMEVRKKNGPSPFKVTQGHWNRVGYLWLLISDPW